jgi:syntaxin-binding protein 5
MEARIASHIQNSDITQVARYGINSQIATIAYDPVQSLLAVGTNESQYGSGQVYVFGQRRVSVTLTIPKRASIRMMNFCADKLVCVDSKNNLIIFSLENRRVLAAYTPPGRITVLLTDPTVDYALIGLQNGS